MKWVALAGGFLLGTAFAVGVRAWRAHRAMWHDEGLWLPANQSLSTDEIIAHAARLTMPEVEEVAGRLISWLPDQWVRALTSARLRRLP